MTIQASMDMSPLTKQIDVMLKQLEEFPKEIGDEFMTWQSEDMHRAVPRMDETASGVQTIITPRGPRSKNRRRRRTTHRRTQRHRPKYMQVRRRARGSRRPILRPILFEMLDTRMVVLMDKELSWNAS